MDRGAGTPPGIGDRAVAPRHVDVGQGGTVFEGVGVHAARGTEEDDPSEGRAVGKGFIADGGHAFRNDELFQFRAVREGVLANGHQGLRQLHRHQCRAVGEGFLPDSGHARNGDVGQPPAVGKCVHRNFGQLRQVDARRPACTVEGMTAHRHKGRQVHTDEGGEILKGTLLQLRLYLQHY